MGGGGGLGTWKGKIGEGGDELVGLRERERKDSEGENWRGGDE